LAIYAQAMGQHEQESFYSWEEDKSYFFLVLCGFTKIGSKKVSPVIQRLSRKISDL
jgi:hypothetical protein